MPVKTLDGLTHVVRTNETPGRFGKTICGRLYTLDTTLIEMYKMDGNPAHSYTATASSGFITCLQCIAEEP
jgi:hypothetical protein